MNLEQMITDVLRAIGAPAHLKGYHLTRYALAWMIEEHIDMPVGVTKHVYTAVSRRFDMSVAAVEHSIRHFITATWRTAPTPTRETLFGAKKPSNIAFLATILDDLRVYQKAGAVQ